MKGITNEKVLKDLELISNLLKDYNEAIWEGQCAQPAHFDNQQKIIRLCIGDVRCGLVIAKQALDRLSQCEIIED